MIQHNEISSLELKHKIRKGEILFGGNKKLKIYGLLNCKSGMRMLQQNRVFFSSEKEAKGIVRRLVKIIKSLRFFILVSLRCCRQR